MLLPQRGLQAPTRRARAAPADGALHARSRAAVGRPQAQQNGRAEPHRGCRRRGGVGRHLASGWRPGRLASLRGPPAEALRGARMPRPCTHMPAPAVPATLPVRLPDMTAALSATDARQLV